MRNPLLAVTLLVMPSLGAPLRAQEADGGKIETKVEKVAGDAVVNGLQRVAKNP